MSNNALVTCKKHVEILHTSWASTVFVVYKVELYRDPRHVFFKIFKFEQSEMSSTHRRFIHIYERR